MGSDNPSGADNQQERPSSPAWPDGVPRDLGHYVAGFVDGEGSFNVPIRRSRDRGMPWRVGLSFNVSQVGSEMPRLLRDAFGVGTVCGRGDGVYYYEVTRVDELEATVFPFFDRFPLRSKKATDLQIFMEIATHIRAGRHRTAEGIEEILLLRSPMNRGGKRRYSDDEIIAVLRAWNPQRPYAELLP